MKKIAKVLKAIHAATKQYDVPADHAFSRQSMEKQSAVAAAEAERAAKAPKATRETNGGAMPGKAA